MANSFGDDQLFVPLYVGLGKITAVIQKSGEVAMRQKLRMHFNDVVGEPTRYLTTYVEGLAIDYFDR